MKSHGRFFFMDKSSILSKGYIRFLYKPVRKQTSSQTYPVYCVVNPDSIDFYIHQIKIVPGSINEADSENNNTEPRNYRLLHLPLSPNKPIIKKTAEVLKKDFTKSFSLGVDVTLLKDKSIHYSNLSAFQIKDNGQISNALYLKDMLLDFLFDFKHSSVFKNSSNYLSLSRNLSINSYLANILSKAEYYYTRQKYIAEWYQEYNSKAKIGANRLYYGKLLIQAEQDWTSYIFKKGAEFFFTHDSSISESWFLKIESELRHIYFDWSEPKRKKSKNHFTLNIYTYLVSFLNSFFLYSGSFRELWICHLEDKGYKDITKNNISIIKDSLRWSISRYDLITSFLIILFSLRIRMPRTIKISDSVRKRLKARILIPRILFTTFMLMIIAINLCNFSNSNSVLLDTLSFLSLVIIDFIVLFVTFTLIAFGSFEITISLLLPRIIAAISSGWIIFLATEEIWKSDFDLPISITYTGFCAAIILLTAIFMIIEIRKNIYMITDLRILKRVLIVITLGFFYSIIIGASISSNISKRMLVRSGYLDDFIYEIKEKENDFLKNQSAKLAYESFNEKMDSCRPIKGDEIYDFITNETISLPNSSQHLSSKLTYKWTPMSKKWELTIFPGYIILNSCLALFIAVFIQLIFAEKTITEPL